MPAMQVLYGSYTFTAGACRFAIRQQAILDARQTPYMYENDIDVTGRLYGEGDGALSILEAQMRTELSRPGRDFGVLRTNSTRSASFWPNANTIGGNVVTNIAFAGTAATEYVFFREFSFSVKNRQAIASAGNAIIEFHETIEYDGGYPEYAFKRAINARPQKQLIWFATEYRVTQSGRAVGFLAYPNPARILFPGDLLMAPKFNRDSPTRHGQNYINFPITWNYTYASVSPLVALPNVWTS